MQRQHVPRFPATSLTLCEKDGGRFLLSHLHGPHNHNIQCLRHSNIPEDLITDPGMAFTSSLMEDLCQLPQDGHLPTSVCQPHPEGDALLCKCSCSRRTQFPRPPQVSCRWSCNMVDNPGVCLMLLMRRERSSRNHTIIEQTRDMKEKMKWMLPEVQPHRKGSNNSRSHELPARLQEFEPGRQDCSVGTHLCLQVLL
ncbi:hypothetical protein DPEC_G00045370 [Dallia pectoralis]|uniref:Uncharacterized protein n=1 Tax=Dallia pectoralis TaxID=75939 RepID=A0ACC2H9P3_DALPE|nr:hypothetical protein DPEC_G00045370 [Dallia pectoralis]